MIKRLPHLLTLMVLLFFMVFNTAATAKFHFSSPQLKKHYKESGKKEHYYLVIDFNDCYNCTQNLRLITNDTNTSVYIALLNFPKSKIPLFEKEYKIQLKPQYLSELEVKNLDILK